MFKGLKDRFDTESKRLSATASNFAQQVRTGASETGSDIGGYTRKFLNSVQNDPNSQNNTSQNLNEETLISLDDDESPNTSAFPGSTEPTERTRRLSDTSIESNESSMSQLFGSVLNNRPVSKLQTIEDELESITDIDNITDEQERTAKYRLFAINYMGKYEKALNDYNEVVHEKEKVKAVFVKVQDKTQKRIENLMKTKADYQAAIEKTETQQEQIVQLQTLLERCRDNINFQKVHNKQLEEKLAEKNQYIESNFDIEKINAEWKGRLDRVDETYGQRLADSEEKAAIAIATVKAESHALLQQKDQDIENWMNKCQSLQKTDSDVNQKYEKTISQLHHSIAALEAEKGDMVEKLSYAKQEGVKLIQEEEERKRAELTAQYEEKLNELNDLSMQVEKELAKRLSALEDAEKTIVQLKEDLAEKNAVAVNVNDLNEKITEYKQQLNDLVAEKNEQAEEFLKKIANLETEIASDDEDSEQVERLFAEIDDYKMVVRTLEAKIAFNSERAKERSDAADKHIDELKEILDTERKNATNFKDEIMQQEETLQKELNDVRAKFEAERAEIERNALHQYHKDSDESVGVVQAQLDDVLGRIAFLEESSAAKEKEIGKYRSQIDEAKQKFAVEGAFILKELFYDDAKLNEFEKLPSNEQLDFFKRIVVEEIDNLRTNTTVNRETVKTISNLSMELTGLHTSNNEKAVKIDELNTELATLRTKISESITTFEKIKELRQEGQKDNDLLETANRAVALIVEKIVAAKKLTMERDQLQSSGTIERVNKLERELLTMKKLLEDVKEENTELVDRSIQIENERADFIETFNSIVSQVGGADDDLGMFEKLSTMVQAVEKLEEIDDVVKECNKHNERLTRANAELLLENESITLMLQQFNVSGTVFEQVEAVVNILQEKAVVSSRLEANYKTLTESYDQLENEISKLKEENKIEADAEKCALTAALEETKTRIVDLESRSAMITAALEDLQAHSDLLKFVNAVVSTAASDSEELRNKVSELVESHLTAQKTSQNVKKELVQIQQELKTISEEKVKVEQQHTELQKSHDDLRVQYMEKEKCVEDFNSQMVKLEDMLKKEQLSHQSVIDQFVSQKDDVAQGHAEIAKLKNELNQMQTSEQQFSAKVTNLENLLAESYVNSKKISEVTQECEKYQKDLAEVREKLAASEDDAKKVNEQMSNLQQRLISSDEQSRKLTEVEILLKQLQAELSLKEGEATISNKKAEMFEQDKIKLQVLVDELQQSSEKLKADVSQLQDEKTGLLDQVQTLMLNKTHGETNNRKIKAVEKEIRDVCRSLEEKSQALEAAQVKIQELEQSLADASDQQNGFSADDDAFHADLDEIERLRGENDALVSENAELVEKLKNQVQTGAVNQANGVEDPLEMRSVAKQHNSIKSDVSHNNESMIVAETEAEYLRNVTYNYMMQRESYGKQSAALAKVIASILKFTPQQKAEVLRKEESRFHGWLE